MSREPLIPAWRSKWADGGTLMVFRCPHCLGTHSHGLPPGDRGIVHQRLSHCWKESSPWFGRGYRLVLVGNTRNSDRLPAIRSLDLELLNEGGGA